MVRIRTDSARGRRWIIPEPHEHCPIPNTAYPDFVTKLLRRRGIESADEAAQFLFDTPAARPDPLLLPGAPAALDRIERAIVGNEGIAVYGDFDVDGVTSSVILTEAIRALGGRVTPYIPDRFTEGYGVHRDALTRLRRDHGISLVITVDCGLSSWAEVDDANAQGQDVIVVDHHTIPDRLPAAHAIVHPGLGEGTYPYRELSAGGLAYRLAPAMMERFGRAVEPDRWLDLATLSTVADVVPLTGENRWIVRDGLNAIRHTSRAGLRALLDVATLGSKALDVEAIAFALAPRLNAAGRLEHAMRAFDLLIETDPDRAADQAAALDRLNLRRRQMTLDAMERANALLANEEPDAPLTFLGDAAIPQGITGLVAGRMAEERYRPAVIYEEGPEFIRASCRSIPEFDVAEALRDCADLLERYGGHRAAAGFTARTSVIPELKERLAAIAGERLSQVPLQPQIVVDGQVPLASLQGTQVAWLARLAPFGAGNPAPTFVSANVGLADARRVGNGGEHLRLTLRDGDAIWPGIGFRLGKCPAAVGDRVDVVWSLRHAGLSGGNEMELEIQDLAPASGPSLPPT